MCASFTAIVHSNRNNQLRGLPAELAQCQEIRDLVLSFNRFPEIPPVVYQLKKLEHIIADDNQVLHLFIRLRCCLICMQDLVQPVELPR